MQFTCQIPVLLDLVTCQQATSESCTSWEYSGVDILPKMSCLPNYSKNNRCERAQSLGFWDVFIFDRSVYWRVKKRLTLEKEQTNLSDWVSWVLQNLLCDRFVQTELILLIAPPLDTGVMSVRYLEEVGPCWANVILNSKYIFSIIVLVFVLILTSFGL